MSFLTKINFAWPLVPNVKLEKEAAIWRYRLLAQHNIIDHKSLFEDYGAFCKKKLSKEKANFWVKKILSKEFDIDEVEKGIIIVTGWLLNAENLPAETIVCFDRHLNSLEKLSKMPDAFLAEHDQRIKYQRTNFESLGQQYLEKLVARTRAKIAAKEIIAIFNPNIMIPHLISLTPRYLKCHLVNDWFEKIRHLSVYGKNEQKKEAELVLKKTLRSMNINKNKIKKRHYAHWGIYFRYRRLRSWLSGFRDAYYGRSDKNFNLDFFKMFCNGNKVPEIYRTHVLSEEMTIRDLIVSIMVYNNEIESEKAFDEIYSKVNKLRKIHEGIEIHLVIEDFLDLPTIHPDYASNISLWNTLEKVQLKSRPT